MAAKLNTNRPSFSPELQVSQEVDSSVQPKAPLASFTGSAIEHILRQVPTDLWASTTHDNRVLFQSNESVELWGDFQGREITALDIPPELIATLQKNIDAVLERESVVYETTFPFANARKRVYHNKICPIRDEEQNAIGVLGVCWDITEQKEKEQLLIARRRLAERLNKASSCKEALKLCFDTALNISQIQLANMMTVNEEGVGHFLFHQGISPEQITKTQDSKINEKILAKLAKGKPLILEPSDHHPNVAAVMRKSNVSQVAQFPMIHNGQIVAILRVAVRKPERFAQWCIDELKSIVSQTEAAIVRLKTQEKLESDRRLLRQLLKMQEQERHLISSEIHDGFVQEVVGAQMVLEVLMKSCGDHDEKCPDFFKQANKMLGRAISEARRFISDLRPLIIEEAGIIEAVNFLINRFDYSVQEKILYTHDESIERFSPIIEGVAFRIIQEGITNAILHSEATKIEINLSENAGLLFINITDNGIGFIPKETIESSFGLRGIIERSTLFAGQAKIESAPGQGTKILVELPIIRMFDSTLSDEASPNETQPPTQ